MPDTASAAAPPLILPSIDDAGRSILAVLSKQTYDIQSGGSVRRAEVDAPIREIDEYYDEGDPETCCVQYESEIAPFKTVTDVVVIGSAHAPGGEPVSQMEVAVDVSGKRKLIHVIGDRFCKYRDNASPEFSTPEPFTAMPIRYERAYGGVDRKSIPGLEFAYPRNHVGKGFVCKNVPEAIDGLPLPNLEDPADLLTPDRIALEDVTSWNRQPLPQGFGWFQKTWYPRCSFVGAVPAFVDPDEEMREEKLGLVPKHQIALARQFKLPSFDIRFNSGASIGLAFPQLHGNETLSLHRLTPDALLEFSLCGQRPVLTLNVGNGAVNLTPFLHTICVRVDDRQVDLIWRGSMSGPKKDWIAEISNLEATAQ